MGKIDFKSKSSGLHWAATKLGHLSAKNPKVTLGIVALITAILFPFSLTPQYDDDVIKFLPEGDPEVARFMEIGERFQGLAVGIVGIEPADGEIFSLRTLEFIRKVSDSLPELEGVGFVTSITTIPDIAEAKSENGESMTDLRDMIGILPSADDPEGPKRIAEMKARALSRDHIRGSLISESGDAALILCTFKPGHPVKPTAEAIEERVRRWMADSEKNITLHFGGAPFIGAYVAEEARRDIARLSPWVSLAVILIMFLTAQSLPGTFIALLSVAISICWIIGLMGILDSPLTLVSSSLPVLLVALGSAYAIHILAQVLANIDRGATTQLDAVLDAVDHVAPPVLVAGLTTALAFLSFLIMDIAPMRTFGLWMASGTLLAVVLGLTVVPAACSLIPLRSRPGGRAPAWAQKGLESMARGVADRPKRAIAAILVLVTVGGFYTAKVDTHMETRAFFEEGSAPVLAEDFLEDKLGGSLFLQVEVAGDIRDPLVLKQIERFEDASAAQEGVTDVQSIASTLRLVNMALSGENTLPISQKRAATLATLSESSDAAMRLLVAPGWKHALVAIKLGGFNTEKAGILSAKLAEVSAPLVLPRIAVTRALLSPEAEAVELQEVAAQVKHILSSHGIASTEEDISNILKKALSGTADNPQKMGAVVRQELEGLLGDPEDPYLILENPSEWTTLIAPCAQALNEGVLEAPALSALLLPLVTEEEKEDPEAFQDGVAAILEYLNDAAGTVRADALGSTLDALMGEHATPKVSANVTRAVMPLLEPIAFVPESAHSGPILRRAELDLTISGYPMIYAGMNRSVYRNQSFSMILSCSLVLLALTWFFRNFWLALAASIPAGITLLVTFGVMGIYDIPMDVGTSMISSIALGVGIDYAVHLVWRYGVPTRDEEHEALSDSLETTGWGIIINALEVTVGFGLLALGTVVPMRHFGLLTALAMVVSALCTLALIPLLTRGVRHWTERKTT